MAPPAPVFLTNKSHDRRLSTHKYCPNGKGVFATEARLGWEEWHIALANPNDRSDATVFLQSAFHADTFLQSTPGGKVAVAETPQEWERWRFERSPHHDGNGFFLVSMEHPDMRLACDEKGHIYTSEGQTGGWETWHAEECTESSNFGRVHRAIVQTACNLPYVYLNSMCHDRRIGTHKYGGNGGVFSTTNRLGWERWTIVHMNQGKTGVAPYHRYCILIARAACS